MLLIFVPPYSDPETRTSAVTGGFVVVSAVVGLCFVAFLTCLLVVLYADYGGKIWRLAVDHFGFFEGFIGFFIMLGGAVLGLAIVENDECAADGHTCRNAYYWYLFAFFLIQTAYGTYFMLSHLTVK